MTEQAKQNWVKKNCNMLKAASKSNSFYKKAQFNDDGGGLDWEDAHSGWEGDEDIVDPEEEKKKGELWKQYSKLYVAARDMDDVASNLVNNPHLYSSYSEEMEKIKEIGHSVFDKYFSLLDDLPKLESIANP